MLKLLLKSSILHLLKYIETHAIQCFAMKVVVLMIFFSFYELPTFAHELNHVHFESIEIIIQMLYIAFISIY
jgi:hypothetical protein